MLAVLSTFGETNKKSFKIATNIQKKTPEIEIVKYFGSRNKISNNVVVDKSSKKLTKQLHNQINKASKNLRENFL